MIFIKEIMYKINKHFNLYSQIEIECQPQMIIENKISF